MANLEQSGTWIPDAYSAKIRFLLKATFYFTKTQVKVPFLPKTLIFFYKNEC